MPPFLPHVPLARNLRHIVPLITLSKTSVTRNTYILDTDMHVATISDTNDDVLDEGEANMDGPEAYFRRFTAAVELAKYCVREISEVEFEDTMESAGC